MRQLLSSAAPLALASLAWLSVACSSASSGGAPSGSPPTPETQAFSYLTNLIPVDVEVSGTTGQGFVDTGNPFVLLDPGVFSAASSLPTNGGYVPSMTIDTQAVSNVYVVPTASGLTSPDPAFPLTANVGCTGICSFVAAFDYKAAVFALGATAPALPAGLEPEITLPFMFEGGSVLDGVTVPRSRVVVQVSLEGTMYSMIVDTGASLMTVSQAAFTALTADGRTQLMTSGIETTSGTSTASVTRAASVAVGGATVDSVVISHDTSFDTNLAAISTDVGHTIDGSLGGTFLHDFVVVIDYPSTTLHLSRYTDLDFAIDEGEAIGIALDEQGGTYSVSAASPKAAGQGIAMGDVVTSIDGVQLGGLAIAQANVLLYGKVGATKSVSFGEATNVANQTLTLTVEEFLPLPAGK
jgi:hypothetical protein